VNSYQTVMRKQKSRLLTNEADKKILPIDRRSYTTSLLYSRAC